MIPIRMSKAADQRGIVGQPMVSLHTQSQIPMDSTHRVLPKHPSAPMSPHHTLPMTHAGVPTPHTQHGPDRMYDRDETMRVHYNSVIDQ